MPAKATKSDTTTVRLTRAAKARLDRLQARTLMATGRRLSLEEILESLIDWAHEDIERVLPPPDAVDEKRLERLFALSGPAGRGPFREEDIDRDLYGG